MTITIQLKSLLLLVTGIIIGASGAILIVRKPVSKSQIKYLHLNDEQFMWCSGDTVYLRNYVDTTFLELYHHGSNQKYSDHIRILTGLPMFRLGPPTFSPIGNVR
jgi:hypothetical protein